MRYWILLVDNESMLINGLEKAIKESIPSNKSTVGVRKLSYGGIPLSDKEMQGCIGIVLSGGPHDTLDPAMQAERDLIRKTKVPLLGICFGMQLICRTYGGALKQLPEGHGGLRHQTITLSPAGMEDGLLSGFPVTLTVASYNDWSVTAVGSGLVVLGRGIGGIEIVRHRRRPVYGVQFHPELNPSATEGVKILERFISLCMDKRGRVK